MQRNVTSGFVSSIGRTLFTAATAAVALLIASRASAALVPQMARCAPYFADIQGDLGPQGLALVNAQAGAGMYNTAPTAAVIAGTRVLHVHFAWAPGPGDANAQAAINGTSRVELCFVDRFGTMSCPGWHGDSNFIVLAPSLGITPPAAAIVKSSETAAATESNLVTRDIPVDWDSPSTLGTVLFFVVNATTEPTTLLGVANDVLRGGSCPVPTRLAERAEPGIAVPSLPGAVTAPDVRFVAYGAATTTPAPPGWIFPSPCSGVADTAKYARFSGATCVDPNPVVFGLHRLGQLDQWQFSVVQNGSAFPPAARKQTWRNGTPSGPSTCTPGAICPTRTLLVPQGGAGFGWGGLVSLTSNPYAAPLTAFDTGAVNLFRDQAHEYFHGLQETWKKAVGNAALYNHVYFGESSADYSATNACVTDYPSDGVTTLPPDKCVSSHSLYYSGGIPGVAYLKLPANAPFQGYPGALFYAYAGAQFAYPFDAPTSQTANLTSFKSVSPVLYDVTGAALPLSLRRPDEGMDLIGYVLHNFDPSIPGAPPHCPQQTSSTADIVKRIECVLEKFIGRNLDDELLEFQTMLVLKDYVDTDERWRLEWLGDFNDGYVDPNTGKAELFPGANPIAGIKALKPFVKSAASGGAGYPSTPDSKLADELIRVRRVHDTYTCVDPSKSCTGANRVVNTLGPGQTVESPQPVALGKWGAAYISIHPDINAAPVNIHIDDATGIRFRIFTINSNGKPTLVPACNTGSPSESCPVTQLATGKDVLDVTVPSLFTPVFPPEIVDEILIVASSGSAPASFRWRFGPSQAKLDIIGPTAASPRSIGWVDATGQPSEEPFVLYFSAKHGDAGLAVTPGNLVISVGGQVINPPGTCPGSACPFTLLAATGGQYMAVVHVPLSLYPSAPGKLDLTISLDQSSAVLSDTEPGALVVGSAPQIPATVLAIDTSGSMVDDGKLAAAEVAAKFVVDGMNDLDIAGLVAFSTQSLTVQELGFVSQKRAALKNGIGSLFAGGSTSIGNGLYRAQDVLASVLDGATFDTRQGILLLTDGANNCSWAPNEYIYENRTGDEKPVAGSGECSAGTIPTSPPWPSSGMSAPYLTPQVGYLPRGKAGLMQPIISGIGLGPTADMSAMDLLANLSGGTRFWLPSLAQVFNSLPVDLGDAFRGAQNRIAGMQRARSAKVPSVSQLPGFQIDPGTTELLVSVLSSSPEVAPVAATLIDPFGTLVPPERATAESAIFRVMSPVAGTYSWHVGDAGPGDAIVNHIFMEVAVKSPCRLYSRTDIPGAELPPALEDPDFDDGRWAGRKLLLQAFLDDGAHSRTDAAIIADVTGPDGVVRAVTLHDDGRHGDGTASDGVFAAELLQTARPGTYQVSYRAHLGGDAACAREERDAVTFRPAPDLDADGLPDFWQTRFDLPSSAAHLDPDRDGLTNLAEFLAATSPINSDTDGGGESDASELASGRDPNDPGDDAVGKPQLVVAPGNARVMFQTGVPVVSGAAVEIQSSSGREGPFTTVEVVTAEAEGPIFVAAENGVEQCYTARLLAGQLSSGWATVVCATPRTDPVPPTITRVGLAGGVLCARRDVIDLVIDASDSRVDTTIGSEQGELADPTVAVSGIAEMNVFADVSPSDVWQPYSSAISLSLGNASRATVLLRVRDAAGNATDSHAISVQRCSGSGLERAILLEERALARFDAGDLAAGRDLVEQSLLEIESSIGLVRERMKALPGGPGAQKALDAALLAGLSGIRGGKRAAKQLGGPKAAQHARKILAALLESEYALADFAAQNRKAL